MATLSPCDTCYVLAFPSCDDMAFDLGLTPVTQYYILIEDKFGNVYTHQYTSAAITGIITLDISLYPDEIFNPQAGYFTLTIKDALTDTSVVDFTIDTTTYDCCKFSTYSTDAV